MVCKKIQHAKQILEDIGFDKSTLELHSEIELLAILDEEIETEYVNIRENIWHGLNNTIFDYRDSVWYTNGSKIITRANVEVAAKCTYLSCRNCEYNEANNTNLTVDYCREYSTYNNIILGEEIFIFHSINSYHIYKYKNFINMEDK